MSESKLVVRDLTRDISLTCHGSDAQRVVAALSADPVTIEELETAIERFMHVDRSQGFFYGASRYLDDEPWDSGLVVIDLAARLIILESTYFWTSHCGEVFYQNGEYGTNIPLRYSLADDWEISDQSDSWQARAEILRLERAQRPTLDTRSVLYGRPLLEFLAAESWNAFYGRDKSQHTASPHAPEESTAAQSPPPATRHAAAIASNDDQADDPCYDLRKEIHARWLMTARSDLGNKTPREVLLDEHERLSEDMQQRRDQWSRIQECPRGLDATSHAFRFGGFGTHELVKYYDLIRELLWSCWEELCEREKREQEDEVAQPAAADSKSRLETFLSGEVARLEHIRDEWLDTPDPECHLRTPRSIIDRERARLPEALFGRDAMIDPDCPCCQMLADLPGPTFMHLDNSGMDWEFPFDIYCRTREEWEAQQREYAEMSRASGDPAIPFGAASSENSNQPASVWSRSFSMAESTDLPLGVRLLGIAWHVAELVMELNELSDSASLVDQLNRDFRNFREVLSDSDMARVDALLDPVVERFDQTLGIIADGHPELDARCSDLARKVKSFREPSAPISS